MNYTIRPILTGYIPNYPKLYYYHHSTYKYYPDVSDEKVSNPCFAFYIEGDGKKILIDTGMAWTERASEYHHPGSYQPEGMAIHEQLAKIGVRMEEIDLAIFTHLHWDHVFYMDQCVNARFIAHDEEYKFAKNPIPLYYKSYEHPALGVTAPFEGLKIETVAGDAEIAPGIRVFDTPGHSPGHIAVEVDTNDGTFIIAGDAAFIMDNFKPIPEIHYSITPPSRFADAVGCWKSIERIRERAQSLDKVLLTHDVFLEERCKTEPVFGLGK